MNIEQSMRQTMRHKGLEMRIQFFFLFWKIVYGNKLPSHLCLFILMTTTHPKNEIHENIKP